MTKPVQKINGAPSVQAEEITPEGTGGLREILVGKKVKLSREQSLAVQLMTARNALVTKNNAIAALQRKIQESSLKSANTIAALESELASSTEELMTALSRAEIAENMAMCQRMGIPVGETKYTMGEDGCYTYTVESPSETQAAGGAPEVQPPDTAV